jgi:hypothetical protein
LRLARETRTITRGAGATLVPSLATPAAHAMAFENVRDVLDRHSDLTLAIVFG